MNNRQLLSRNMLGLISIQDNFSWLTQIGLALLALAGIVIGSRLIRLSRGARQAAMVLILICSPLRFLPRCPASGVVAMPMPIPGFSSVRSSG